MSLPQKPSLISSNDIPKVVLWLKKIGTSTVGNQPIREHWRGQDSVAALKQQHGAKNGNRLTDDLAFSSHHVECQMGKCTPPKSNIDTKNELYLLSSMASFLFWVSMLVFGVVGPSTVDFRFWGITNKIIGTTTCEITDLYNTWVILTNLITKCMGPYLITNPMVGCISIAPLCDKDCERFFLGFPESLWESLRNILMECIWIEFDTSIPWPSKDPQTCQEYLWISRSGQFTK